jgi:hypothetical protein
MKAGRTSRRYQNHPEGLHKATLPRMLVCYLSASCSRLSRNILIYLDALVVFMISGAQFAVRPYASDFGCARTQVSQVSGDR